MIIANQRIQYPMPSWRSRQQGADKAGRFLQNFINNHWPSRNKQSSEWYSLVITPDLLYYLFLKLIEVNLEWIRLWSNKVRRGIPNAAFFVVKLGVLAVWNVYVTYHLGVRGLTDYW